MIFTANVELDVEVSHECPLRKSDHELLEMKTLEDETQEGKRTNYAKPDYIGLKILFIGVHWADL